MSRKGIIVSALISLCLVGSVRSFSLGGLLGPEIGSGGKFAEEDRISKGEKGDTGRITFHLVDKGAKGFHNKEANKGFYGEIGGNKKSHHDDGGYNNAHDLAIKGQKGFRYADHKSWAKGHNTKGSHHIHKLDEFKKNTEFSDEDKDNSFKEKHGGYDKKASSAAGSKEEEINDVGAIFDSYFGLQDVFGNDGESSRIRGHIADKGADEYHSQGEKFDKGGGSGLLKKWGLHFY